MREAVSHHRVDGIAKPNQATGKHQLGIFVKLNRLRAA